MNINLELYHTFYIVAKNKNITAAAKELKISQPAISKAIKNLENQLGGKLFTRTKKGVFLTEEGKQFYYYIKTAIETINNAEQKFNNLIKLECGIIRIGSSKTLTLNFLLPYLKEFHQLYPKIKIELDTDTYEKQIKKLRNGELDVIIKNIPTTKEEGVISYKIAQIHDCFVVNKNYFELTKKTIKLEELQNYPLILQPENNNTRKFLNEVLREQNIEITPTLTLASHTLVIAFTKIGYGIGYATKEYIEKEIKNKELYILNVEPNIPERSIGVILPKNSITSLSTQKLLNIIKKSVNKTS